MEELESELERKAEAQKEAGMPDDEEEAAYETEDSLPAKDDADKTRPTRRRRKKAKVDENGEVSPAILIAQLRRLRGNLSRMSVGTENEDSAEGTEGTSAADAGSMARTHALLAKLGEMKDVASIPELSANFDGNSLERSPGETVTPNSTSRIDARLQVLEKYVGANEADIDEVCVGISFLSGKVRFAARFRSPADALHPICTDTSAASAPLEHPGSARETTPAVYPTKASRYHRPTGQSPSDGSRESPRSEAQDR